MFELLTGQPPWMGENVETLKYNISRMRIKWPKHMDPDAVDLIKKTLRYNPDERISLRNMLIHPFFTKYDPGAVNSLFKPDGKKPRIYIISKDNPQINYSSSSDISDINDKNNVIYNNYNNSYISNNNYDYSSIKEIPYTPPVNTTTASYPIPSLQQTNYISTLNNNNIINNNYVSSSNYSNTPLNNLNIMEMIENQERIDELVRKTVTNEFRSRNPFQSANLEDFDLNNSRQIYQSQSSYMGKTQSSPYYSIKPITYNKPKIIYSSLTARKNFEGGQFKSNLYSKYDFNLK